MHKCHLLLGSNLGDRAGNIFYALNLIELQIGPILSVSTFYETEPWGFYSSKLFLNKAAIVETWHTPHEILRLIHHIEKQLGRDHEMGSGYLSRTIDIDILFYDNEIIASETLSIPHPQLHNRKFVLVPLCEISPLKSHPVLKKSIQNLLDECSDQSFVRIYNKTTT